MTASFWTAGPIAATLPVFGGSGVALFRAVRRSEIRLRWGQDREFFGTGRCPSCDYPRYSTPPHAACPEYGSLPP